MTSGLIVKKALRWMILGSGFTQFVSWLVTLFVIRILAPADYGLLAMASLLILLAQMLQDMGLSQALIQTTRVTDLVKRQIFTACTIINLTLFLLVLAVAPVVAASFGEPAVANITRMLAFQFPLTAMICVPSAMLSRDMDFKKKSIVNASGALSNSMVTLGMALLGFGVWSLVFGALTAALVRLILLAASQKILFRPTADFSGFSQLASFGGWMTVSGFLYYIQMQSPTYLLGKFLGKESLGLFNVAFHLATLPMQKISGILGQIGLAAFSRIQSDHSDVQRYFLQMQTILATIAIPIFWGIASIADSLVPVVLGDKWHLASTPLMLIAIATPFRMFLQTTASTLYGIGKAKLNFRNQLISASTLAPAFFLGLDWGINGVAAVWVVFFIPLFVLLEYRCLNALGVRMLDFWKVLARPLSIGVLMFLAVRGLNASFAEAEISQLARLLILIVTGAAFYGFASIIFNREALVRAKKLLL